MYLTERETSAHWSRRRILLTIMVSIFVTETCAMFLLPVLLPTDIAPWIEALTDATLLSLGCLPLLWFLLIQPMHAAVRKSSHQADMLMKALDAHALVSISDVRGRITYANKQFCEISQYTLDELVGQDHRIVNSGHHPKLFMKSLWNTIQRGETWHGEVKNRARDGSFYWVQATIVPFTDEHGNIEQYVAIRANITDMKYAEQQVEHYNEELEGQKEELQAQHDEIIERVLPMPTNNSVRSANTRSMNSSVRIIASSTPATIRSCS